MFNKLSIAVILLLSSLTQLNAQDIKKCAYNADHIDDLTEKHVRDFLKGDAVQKSDHIYQIPVVVHILYRTGREEIGVEENISDFAIHRYLEELNHQFRKVAGTTGDGSGVDTHIEMILASKDPNGSITTGINRVNASGITHFDTYGYRKNQNSALDNTQAIYDLMRWDTDKYLNVWITWNINVDDSDYDGFAGYFGAFLKYSTSSQMWSHEFGHCFGLMHTFEGGCSETNCSTEGDRVCDTPPTTQNAYASSMNACLGSSPCGTTSLIKNYMDYSLQSCKNMFTAGQRDRMHAFLENPFYIFNSVWQTDNLAATGTNGEVPPQAAFLVNSRNICIRDTTFFTDKSTRSPGLWEWQFEDGYPAFSAERNPKVVFLRSGNKRVSLKVANSYGEDIKVFDNYIDVFAAASPQVSGDAGEPGSSLTLSATGLANINWFETITSEEVVFTGNSFTTPALNESKTYYAQDVFPQQIVKTGLQNSSVSQASTIGFMTFNVLQPVVLKSVKIYVQATPVHITLRDNDNVIIKEWNVTSSTPMEQRLDIDEHLTARNNYRLCLENVEEGWLFFNNNNFSFPYNIPSHFTITGSYFYEGMASDNYLYFYDWEIQKQECPSMKVEVTATINSVEPDPNPDPDPEPNPNPDPETPPTSVNSKDLKKDDVKIVPNPFTTETTIGINTVESGFVKVSVMDKLGKNIYTVYDGNLPHGSNNFIFNRQGIQSGLYFVIVEVENQPSIVKKLIAW